MAKSQFDQERSSVDRTSLGWLVPTNEVDEVMLGCLRLIQHNVAGRKSWERHRGRPFRQEDILRLAVNGQPLDYNAFRRGFYGWKRGLEPTSRTERHKDADYVQLPHKGVDWLITDQEWSWLRWYTPANIAQHSHHEMSFEQYIGQALDLRPAIVRSVQWLCYSLDPSYAPYIGAYRLDCDELFRRCLPGLDSATSARLSDEFIDYWLAAKNHWGWERQLGQPPMQIRVKLGSRLIPQWRAIGGLYPANYHCQGRVIVGRIPGRLPSRREWERLAKEPVGNKWRGLTVRVECLVKPWLKPDEAAAAISLLP